MLRRNSKVVAFLLIVLVISAIVGFKIWQAKTQKVATADKTCALDSDCTIVPTGCSGCSCGEAANKKFVQKYIDLNISECKNYHGPVCEVVCDKNYAKCINKSCTLSDKK